MHEAVVGVMALEAVLCLPVAFVVAWHKSARKRSSGGR